MLGIIKIFEKLKPTNLMPPYPYEFPTSGFARVDEIRFLIQGQSDWDYCYDTDNLIDNNLEAAKRFGFEPNLGLEEVALSDMIKKLKAGPHIMTYAWGLYADIIKSRASSH
jgi:hypothetical protein